MNPDSVYALLSAGSYWDIRKVDLNQAPIPEGWKVLRQFDVNSSGATGSNPLKGFSARVYQGPAGEIVISYAGTEFAATSGLVNDFISGNIPLALGRYGEQAYQAALLYQQVQNYFGAAANIKFTGHSLGGGLASLMTAWFDRPSVVFAPAPFEASALKESVLFGTAALTGVKQKLVSAGYDDPKFRNYVPATDFAAREAKVQSYGVVGEVVGGLPIGDRIEGNRKPLYATASWGLTYTVTKHSIDLHAAALVTPIFDTAASALPSALPLIFEKKLYGFGPMGVEPDLLLKLVRNEVGVRNEAGTQVLLLANGMLTHFANDLQKLGTNLAGLNKAAQDAIISQGIEWYYWQGNDYAGQQFFYNNSPAGLLQYTTAKGDGLTGALSKADLYTKPWLQAIAAEHGLGSSVFPAFGTAYSEWSVAASATQGVVATALNTGKTQIMLGQGGADKLTGGSKDDVMLAGAGNDTLNGGAGNDILVGGKDSDTYTFTDAWGKDIITDSDGQGQIKLGQAPISATTSQGRDLWSADLGGGVYAGLAVYTDASSSTGKSLVITKGGDTSNTITIKNFDLVKAKTSEGYLGIKLSTTVEVALVAQGTPNQGGTGISTGVGKGFWSQAGSTLESLAGKTSSFIEGAGKSFTVSLNKGAKAGDTVTLNVAGGASGLKAVRAGGTVDANGAVFTLREGQTQVSFALVSDSPIDADQSGAVSVSYQGTGDNAQSATSNSWAVTVKDAGEPANAEHPLEGDILVKTETYTSDTPLRRIKNYGTLTLEDDANVPSYIVLEQGDLYYAQDGTGNLDKGTEDPTIRNVYNEEGELTGTQEIPSDDKTITDNTLFGSAAKDKIDGKTGNDLIDGKGGNDQIDGGSGTDMIGGGAGSDNIKGGDGDDYISSSANIIDNRQQISATDLWANWGVPDGKTAVNQGAMWGTYLSEDTAEFKVTVWASIANTSTDKTDTEGDVIDGGAGDDWMMGSWAGDRIQGGEGKDNLDGLAGDDILEGGAGDDSIQADGIIKGGYLNSVDAARPYGRRARAMQCHAREGIWANMRSTKQIAIILISNYPIKTRLNGVFY